VSGRYRHSTGEELVEMVELPEHPWFLGCQFHPELLSRPLSPHPLFVQFIKASLQAAKGTQARLKGIK
jgi:CTP synthase